MIRFVRESLVLTCERWCRIEWLLRNSPGFPRIAVAAGPKRRSARSINVCERTGEPRNLPVEVMCRVQRQKTAYSGQRGCILWPCQG